MGRGRDFVSSLADPAQGLAVVTRVARHERLFLGLDTQRAPALCEIRTCSVRDGWDGGGALLGVVVGPHVPELTAFTTQAAIFRAVQQTAGEPPCTRLGLRVLRPPEQDGVCLLGKV